MSFQLQNSEVLARLKPFGISFEKSLSDLIKGIRANSKDSPEQLSTYLNDVILECKNELQTTDIETKASAILKLTYLEMYGFDMSWSNFQILEVMSSSKFQQKRIGYLAAIQSFKNEQDLLILATNQFKKDLNSSNHIEIGLALSGIATIVTPNLSKDINDDVLIKLSHSNPYIRKKAILAMFKIFLQYPESLKLNFQKVIDKLDDPDLAVVSSTINVICEISKKQPKIFINYLPKFFNILQDSKNNWLIIRILKLFQSLSKVEPRIKKKIIPIILDLMMKTKASSLIYECINCISNGSMLDATSGKDKETAKFCISKLMEFFKTNDSNLKFVGLIALINLVKIFPTFIKSIDGVSDVIMDCLNDNDLIIKRKSLEICHFLVDENNLSDVVKVLLVQLIPTENRNISETLKQEIVLKILEVSGQGNYENIPNFKWYIAVLRDVMNLTLVVPKSANRSSSLPDTLWNTTIGATALSSPSSTSIIAIEIGKEFKNLATKVPSIRSLIINKVIFESIQNVEVLESCSSLLKDFYWIMGEYISEISSEPNEDDDEDDEEENTNGFDSNNSRLALSLGKKIEILNTIVNTKIDQALNLSSNARFVISKKLISLDNPDVLIVLIQSLVKVFNGIVSDFLSLYTKNSSTIEKEHYYQLTYYLYKVIEFLTALENHSNYEVQERSLSWLEFLKLLLEALTNGNLEEVMRLRNEEVEYYRNLKSSKKMTEEIDSEEEDEEEEEEEEDDDDEENSEEESEEEDSDDSEYEHLESEEEDGKPGIVLDTDLKLKANPFSDDIKETLLESVPEIENNDSAILNGSKELQLPILLTHILPSFFKSYQLNPIEKNAQRKIAIPDNLDLESQINIPPIDIVSDTEVEEEEAYNLFISDYESDSEKFAGIASPALTSDGEDDLKKRKERLERLRDDPYYIGTDDNKKNRKSKKLTLLNNDSTPDSASEVPSIQSTSQTSKKPKSKQKKLKKEKVVILTEETIEGSHVNEISEDIVTLVPKKKKNAFKIDSSNLDNLDLNSASLSEGPAGKEYEYEIDLDALRKKLAESSVTEKPKKKKSSKDGKKSESKEKKSKSNSKDALKDKKSKEKQSVAGDKLSPEVVNASKLSGEDKVQNIREGTPDSTTNSTDAAIITVKKPKKTKKKKAVIIE